MKLLEIIEQNLVITLDELKDDVELILDLQTQLHSWGLYPGSNWLDGDYGSVTNSAFTQFAQLKQLNPQKIDRIFALALLNPETEILINTAQDKEQVFQLFLDSELGFNESNLRIRDHLIDNSLYQEAIASYPQRLTQKPDQIEIRSTHPQTRTIAYPERGIIPDIDPNGLNFLHNDITEACLCLGYFVDGQMQTRWLGKNALDPVQFWSSTKFIAPLNIISQLNTKQIQSDIDNCVIKSSPQALGISFHQLAIDVVSYRHQYGSSNSIGAMFKRLTSYTGLDQWLKAMTGNNQLTFQGRYGENEFYSNPQLFDRQLNQTVLQAPNAGARGENLVSAYDLTRMMTMLGWHYHLSASARLPGAQWYSLESLVRAMGYDRSRYLDFAIARLGLAKVIKDPVIISKVGWGPSDQRNRYEIVYTALVKFVDRRLTAQKGFAEYRTFALTLRSAKALSPRNLDQEARQLDARMVTEVTDILRRILIAEI